MRALTAAFWPFARLWFRPRIEGLEHIPAGRCVVVGNHSGFAVMELFLLLAAWTRRHGTSRPVAGLTHDLGADLVAALGRRADRRGSAPHRADAHDALERGLPVLVFPGGDVDALRPFSARDEVRWGGRSGFLDVALEAGAPIVPLAICGSHAQYTILPGGRTIARVLGLRRFRLETWPVPLGALLPLAALVGAALSLCSWLWVFPALALSLFPNPTRIEIRFLPPIDPAALVARHGGSLPAAAEELRALIEREVQALAATRRTPWG